MPPSLLVVLKAAIACVEEIACDPPLQKLGFQHLAGLICCAGVARLLRATDKLFQDLLPAEDSKVLGIVEGVETSLSSSKQSSVSKPR